MKLDRENLRGALAVALGAVIASCVIHEAPPPTPPVYRAAPGGAPGSSGAAIATDEGAIAEAGVPPVGDYACSFQRGPYRYPPFPCRVFRDADGALRLEKLGGSQRIRGVVTPIDDYRFAFSGVYYCPWGSCTERVAGEFGTVDNGLYRGELRTGTGATLVTLDYRPEGFASGGVGGNGYGGNGYGGNGYGGNGYGGNGYGQLQGPRLPGQPYGNRR